MFALAEFARAHGRLPDQHKILNDQFFRIKTSKEIEHPLRVFTSDKEYVKLYIKAIVGEEYNIKTLGIIHNDEELNNFEFPKRCAIKTTAGCDEVIIKQETDTININDIKPWLTKNQYDIHRERNYKTLVPKIIVEELVFDQSRADDIKIFCVKGKVKLIQYDFDRFKNHQQVIFDAQLNNLKACVNCPLYTNEINHPDNLKEMIQVAEKLSEPFSLVRVDMYTNGKKCYMGEITHVHQSSLGHFNSKEAEKRVSKALFETK